VDACGFNLDGRTDSRCESVSSSEWPEISGHGLVGCTMDLPATWAVNWTDTYRKVATELIIKRDRIVQGNIFRQFSRLNRPGVSTSSLIIFVRAKGLLARNDSLLDSQYPPPPSSYSSRSKCVVSAARATMRSRSF
jgi:hypothetical protein